MNVRLLFFAVLRDIAGVDARDLTVAEGTTAREVWEMLRNSYPKLADYVQPPMTAIKESYAAPDAVLREGDELAFIPPVAGG